jgi:transposase
MLKAGEATPLNDLERQIYEQLVPVDHFLRRLLGVIDFERFRPALVACYSSEQGRPAVDPIWMLKLEVLARHYNLSDRDVMSQTQVNIAFRWFVGLGLGHVLPHHTSLTYFRQRVGEEQLQTIFQMLLGQARELGLVRDRLRLKDATHIIANIAVPSTIRLVSETRDRLLEALEPLASQRVEQERQRALAIRAASADLKNEERLLRRVAHLRAVLAWADDVPQQAVFADATEGCREHLREALAVAHKVLADRDPQAKDKLVSIHDPDARLGKHGDYYRGYLLDAAVDADSELITGINVLPANADEAANARPLIEQEERAHGNDVEALSMDGIGYRGSLLRELRDEQGLNLDVFVPPTEQPDRGRFGPERFMLSDDGSTLTCPGGQTTAWRQASENGTRFHFSASACAGCPLRDQCLPRPDAQRRAVLKNHYEAEYRAAQTKAQTPEYARVRREHKAIERKLAELVCRHEARHARYRGLPKVRRQGILTALVVNMKRMVRLLPERLEQALGPPPLTETVRAGLATGG